MGEFAADSLFARGANGIKSLEIPDLNFTWVVPILKASAAPSSDVYYDWDFITAMM